MRYLAMIQARCGSSRLPGKVMKNLCGKPSLQWVIERAQGSQFVDEVMVITSIDQANLPILGLCSKIGVRVGVGSEDDVLDRYYQTAKLLSPEYVIRLTGDCPCFDGELLDEAIRQLDPEADYCGMLSETFADGLDLEIMKFTALKRSWMEAEHSFEREHVTQYIIRHPERFKLQDFVSPLGYFGDQRWTVDEAEDFQMVSRIYDYFVEEKGQQNFGYRDILQYLKKHPEIAKINQIYRRNEGLDKSIDEDVIVGRPEKTEKTVI